MSLPREVCLTLRILPVMALHPIMHDVTYFNPLGLNSPPLAASKVYIISADTPSACGGVVYPALLSCHQNEKDFCTTTSKANA